MSTIKYLKNSLLIDGMIPSSSAPRNTGINAQSADKLQSGANNIVRMLDDVIRDESGLGRDGWSGRMATMLLVALDELSYRGETEIVSILENEINAYVVPPEKLIES